MTLELYFLGAGRPATGEKPAALKNIALKYKAIDWQLHSFADVVEPKDIHFIGGYHVEEISALYPKINYKIVSDWHEKSALYTLFHAPFTGLPVFLTYTDTLFRKEHITSLSKSKLDAVFVVDTSWEHRYASRTPEDIEVAETLNVNGQNVEFTGLIYLSEKSVEVIRKEIEMNGREKANNNILGLIPFLQSNGIEVDFFDIQGEWAEFNSPVDIANFVLGTKADTLARLEGVVSKSKVGKQISFTVGDWNNSSVDLVNQIQKRFGDVNLVVRSSSKAEDNWHSSNAGGFESILNVSCFDDCDLNNSIEKVIESYGELSNDSDQVLVQEFVMDVAMAGVVFTCTLESGAPYYRFNFDDTTRSTESVTAGMQSELRTVLVNKVNPSTLTETAPELLPVLAAIEELEELLGFDKLDIEFAVDTSGIVHLFQVRPVVVSHENYEIDLEDVRKTLAIDVAQFDKLQSASPFMAGDETIFANMPDWNPAEIIGTRPKPLALSLYQQLITNDIWSIQRAEFGYKDVRPAPLLIAFSGQPYIDVRSSFNSFIPETVSAGTQEKIVSAYLKILKEKPHLHDKVEFDVAFTIWTPDLYDEACKRLIPYGVTKQEVSELVEELKSLTRNALVRLSSDIASVNVLDNRLKCILNSNLSVIRKAYAVLDDCKRFGTLAFAHAARAGFVATTFLKYLISNNKLSEERRLLFMNSFNTIAGQFESDKQKYSLGKLTREELVSKYGHLRPGTYEVTTQAYWEDPDLYIIPKGSTYEKKNTIAFEFNSDEKNAMQHLLKELGSSISVSEFIDYLVVATQQREEVKFKFTKNLSAALDLLVDFGQEVNLSRDEVSYLTYHDIEILLTQASYSSVIKKTITARQKLYQVTKIIELPPFISKSSNFYSFERHSSLPNFVGVDRIVADLEKISKQNQLTLKGKVVMIPQADPGYDWLFGLEIAGLITKYGGANSHMAIRSAEIGLPAAIGVGEKVYDSLISAKVIELDCLNHILRVIE